MVRNHAASLLLLSLLGFPTAAHAMQTIPIGGPVDTELQRGRDAFSGAYVRGDFAAMANLYTADAVLLPADRVVRGRSDIEQYFTYGPNRIQVAHSMTPKSLERLDANTVVEIGVWSSTAGSADQPAGTASGRHMLVWHRVDGRWLIAYDVWHRPPAVRPEPRKVQEGTVSAPDRNETFPAIDPSDNSLWFSVLTGSFADQRLMRAPRKGDSWGPPAPAPVAADWPARAPRFSVDGSTLYFTSARDAGGETGTVQRIWAAERHDTGWSEPRLLPAPVNSGEGDMHVSAAPDGGLFIASTRSGGRGRSDVWRIPHAAGGWGAAEALPAEINDELSQSDVLVAPDGSWLIVAVTDHPLGLGGDDLFLSRRTVHGWTPLEHIPAPINSQEYEYGPSLTPDGRSLLFTSHRGGSADVYVIPLAALGLDPAH